MSDSVRPHRWQPTRFPHPWDSPGKNTGVGCHFLLQCVKVKSESEVAQSCLTLSDPMEGSLPGSSIHGICQARVLEWGATTEQQHRYLERASLVAQWQRTRLSMQSCGFSPCVGKITWRRKWHHTPVFLPEKSPGQRSLVGYHLWDCRRVQHDLVTKKQ